MNSCKLPSERIGFEKSATKIGFLTKLVLGGLAILMPGAAYVHGLDYVKQNADQVQFSSFESAATKLGFDSISQQEAMLKIFYYAGYLDPHQLWVDLHRMALIKDSPIKDPSEVFQSLYPILAEAHADQGDDRQFHPEILRKKLFGNLSVDGSVDLLLYIAQNAFNRKLGQERNELRSQDWMSDYKDKYLKAAHEIGLIDRINPSYEEYDEAWIAGASRVGVLSRVIDFFNSGIKVKGDTLVLAGARELWAEIDGIKPSILTKLMNAAKNRTNIDDLNIIVSVGNDEERNADGVKYIVGLAKRSGIKLDADEPIIQYADKADCPTGRLPGRSYPNYAKGETRKIDESLMAQDMLDLVAKDKGVSIVHTQAAGADRPTTATTAKDGFEALVVKIESGTFGDQKIIRVALQSNQPYAKRQADATQMEGERVFKAHGLDKKGFSLAVDGVGFKNKQDIAATHSEFAALISERVQHAIVEGTIPDHDVKNYLFQWRDSTSLVPDYPEVSTLHAPIHADLEVKVSQ